MKFFGVSLILIVYSAAFPLSPDVDVLSRLYSKYQNSINGSKFNEGLSGDLHNPKKGAIIQGVVGRQVPSRNVDILRLFGLYAAASYCIRYNIYPRFHCGYPRCSNKDLTISTFFTNTSFNNTANYSTDILASTEIHSYLDKTIGFIGTNSLLDKYPVSDLIEGYESKESNDASLRRKTIIVSFRGTLNLNDIRRDVMLFPTQYEPRIANKNADFFKAFKKSSDEEISVHQGFLGAFKAAESSLVDKIRSIVDEEKVKSKDKKAIRFNLHMSGHSLGGAVAVLSAVELSNRIMELRFPGFEGLELEIDDKNKIFKLRNLTSPLYEISLNVYTYGEPRVGNSAFAKYVEALPITVNRVAAYNDLIVHLPPKVLPISVKTKNNETRTSAKYEHHGSEIFILSDGQSTIKCLSKSDPICSEGNQFPNLISHLKYWDINFGPYC